MRCVGILGLALLVCFVVEAFGQPASSGMKSVAGTQLAEDTPMTTTSGATFKAPLGWSVTSNANKVLLAPLGSLRPNGYQRETFAGRKAHPLDAERVALLKNFVLDVMRQFGIPGVGLSFIDGGIGL
jgi:hypothetical protein